MADRTWLLRLPATVAIELVGMPSQRKEGQRLLRVEPWGVAVVASEFVVGGEAFYAVADGRRCGSDGQPCPWDLWRITPDSIARIREAMVEEPLLVDGDPRPLPCGCHTRRVDGFVRAIRCERHEQAIAAVEAQRRRDGVKDCGCACTSFDPESRSCDCVCHDAAREAFGLTFGERAR